MKLKDACSFKIHRRKAVTNLDQVLKSRDITLPTKVHLIKAMVFPIVMLWMWESDHKEGWTLENWCFWTVVLEKTLKSPLDSKEIQAIHPKGNQSWIFIGMTDAEAQAPILWPHDVKSWLIVCWQRLKAREGDGRERDGQMAPLTQWTGVWASSGR